MQCQCLHCPGSIEFESPQDGTVVVCPHCGVETTLSAENDESRHPSRATGKRKHDFLYYVLVGMVSIVMTLCVLLFGMFIRNPSYLDDLEQSREEALISAANPTGHVFLSATLGKFVFVWSESNKEISGSVLDFTASQMD